MLEWISDEHEKINAVLNEIIECVNLKIIDFETYENIKIHLDEKFDRFSAMSKAVIKYKQIYFSIPVTGPMGRKNLYQPEPLNEEEIALLHEVYEAVFPDFG